MFTQLKLAPTNCHDSCVSTIQISLDVLINSTTAPQKHTQIRHVRESQALCLFIQFPEEVSCHIWYACRSCAMHLFCCCLLKKTTKNKTFRCRVWLHVCPCITVNTAATFQCFSPNHCDSNLLARSLLGEEILLIILYILLRRLWRRLTRLKMKYASNHNQSSFSLSCEE